MTILHEGNFIALVNVKTNDAIQEVDELENKGFRIKHVFHHGIDGYLYIMEFSDEALYYQKAVLEVERRLNKERFERHQKQLKEADEMRIT